jgi:hypothetical protein
LPTDVGAAFAGAPLVGVVVGREDTTAGAPPINGPGPLSLGVAQVSHARDDDYHSDRDGTCSI